MRCLKVIKFRNSEFLNYRTVWAGQTFVSDLILLLQNDQTQKFGQHIPTTEDRFAKRNQSVIIEGFGQHIQVFALSLYDEKTSDSVVSV